MIQLLMICCLLGLGSAWNQLSTSYKRQPSTCYVSQADDPEYIADIARINELLGTLSSLESSLASMNESLQQLVDQQECPTAGSLQNPASSCRDIPQDSPSGEYWILTSSTQANRVYCDMDRLNCSCNDRGGWMRVANLDMTDPSQQCPDGFRLVSRTTAPLRTCGRIGAAAGCVSTTYQTYGVEYSHVCGQIRGYQEATPSAFSPAHISLTIDSYYVDGVSLTHGQSPRQHIWSFGASADELQTADCPCIQSGVFTGTILPFIGQDYFCDTGSRDHYQFLFYADDPLWDGQGCGGTSTCCEFNSPPWFCKQLPQPTTDDIELRICGDQDINDEDTPLDLVEIYVR